MDYFENLLEEAQTPETGIWSRSLRNDDTLKLVLFSFAEGEELSEHTSSLPAVIQILDGRARLMLGGKTVEGGPGTLIYMEPNLPHAVTAVTAFKMLLTLVKTSE